MPLFTAKIDQFQFDGQRFLTSMERGCRELMRDAAKFWLTQVLKHIPIRTGFLVGSFSGLEDMLGVNVPKFGSPIQVPNRAHPAVIRHFSDLKNKRLQLHERKHDITQRLVHLERERSRVERRAFDRSNNEVRSEFNRGKVAGHEATQELTQQGSHAEAHTANIDARIKRLTAKLQSTDKAIERLNKYSRGSRSHVASRTSDRTTADVLTELHTLREQLASTRRVNNLRDRLANLKDLDRHNLVHNPQIGEQAARYEKRYVDITKETEPTQAERFKALRAGKKLEKRIEILGHELKRVQTSEAKKFYLFKEYYRPSKGTKILKTPRSGVQFTTPLDEVFQESTPQDLFSRLSAQQAALERYRQSGSDKIGGTDDPGDTRVDRIVGTYNDAVSKQLEQQIAKTKTFFTFNFAVNISYYDVNDFYKTGKFGQKPMPWLSQEAGAKAFYQYLQQNAASKLPKIDGLVTTRQLLFNGQNVPQTLRIELER